MPVSGVNYDGVVYDGAHSVTFGVDLYDDFQAQYNTWTDWALIPASKPVIAMPTITSRKYIEIPGMQGSLDLSKYIAGGLPTYSDRTGSLEFIVLQRSDKQLAELKNLLATYLSTDVLRIRLEDERSNESDPGFYYRGRFNLAQWQSGADYPRATIEYHLEPFKLNGTTTTRGTFSITEGTGSVIPITVTGSQIITVTASLVNYSSGDYAEVYFGSTSPVNLDSRSRKATMMPVPVVDSENLNLYGQGTVKITYKVASL